MALLGSLGEPVKLGAGPEGELEGLEPGPAEPPAGFGELTGLEPDLGGTKPGCEDFAGVEVGFDGFDVFPPGEDLRLGDELGVEPGAEALDPVSVLRCLAGG